MSTPRHLSFLSVPSTLAPLPLVRVSVSQSLGQMVQAGESTATKPKTTTTKTTLEMIRLEAARILEARAIEVKAEEEKAIGESHGVIFFNLDGVLLKPQNATFNRLNSKALHVDKLKKLAQFSKANQIALYLVSAKTDQEWHNTYIEELLNEINGFQHQVGGFKRTGNHSLQSSDAASVSKEISNIYQKELTHLPKFLCMFVGYAPDQCEAVREAGFAVIPACIGVGTHYKQILDYFKAIKQVSYIHTLGNYAVLLKNDQMDLSTIDRTEYLRPYGNGAHVWRMRLVPNFSKLCQVALEDPSQRKIFYKALKRLGYKQAIFFSDDPKEIFDYILKHSFGTVTSLEDLLAKGKIIILGSEGERKASPLKAALSDLSDVAIVGLAADSGVDMQPVGHVQTSLGCLNRGFQVSCFEYGLKSCFKQLNDQKSRAIISLAIENGMGLFPVISIDERGRMQVAANCLTSNDGKLFHFCDQAILWVKINNQVFRHFARPSMVLHTLVSDNFEKLKKYFCDDKPRDQYYLKQSEFTLEMLARIKNKQADAFPVRQEGDKLLTSNDLIQEALSELFNQGIFKFIFPKLAPTRWRLSTTTDKESNSPHVAQLNAGIEQSEIQVSGPRGKQL